MHREYEGASDAIQGCAGFRIFSFGPGTYLKVDRK